MLARFRLWIRAVTGRRRADHDLDREMRFHLEMEIEQRIRDGMAPDDARRTALLAFGGVEHHKEAVRDERGTRLIEEFISDVRLALRAFRARPAFVATAAITMAFGIGAATAVFSVVNGLLLRPVPGLRAPGELVRIDLHRDHGSSVSPSGLSYANLMDLQHGTPALPELAASAYFGLQLSAIDGGARGAQGSVIGGDYFELLGVRAQVGRLFDASERTPTSGARVAVISDRLWHAVFQGETKAVGQTMRANGVVFTIIGIAPKGFLGIDRVGDIDVWLPLGSFGELRHFRAFDPTDRRMNLFSDVFGRLSAGATAPAAQSQIRAALARLSAAFPVENKGLDATMAYVTQDVGLIGFRREWIVHTLRLLAIIAAIVVVVSCASTINLLLVRGIRRRGEIAVRRALGASGGRIVRQQITEGVTLAVFGCVAGVVVTLGFRMVLGSDVIGALPPLSHMPIDWRVLAFAIGVSLATGAVFATVPAVMSSRSSLLDGLTDATRSTSGRTLRLRDALSVVQLAAAMSLVVGALLLARSIHSLRRVDVGFDVEHTAMFVIDPVPQGYDAARVREFRSRLSAELLATTGIDGVASASTAPFAGGAFGADLRPGGYDGSDWPVKALSFAVEPKYFNTLRIPLVAGSLPAERQLGDSSGPSQVVISSALARRLFAAANPVGRTIEERGYRTTATYVVVGVVGDVRTGSLRDDVESTVYVPIEKRFGLGSVVVVHSSRSSAVLEPLVRQAMAKVDPAVPITMSWTMSDGIGRSIATERLFERLVTTLAVISAVLAGAGLYGIIAYSVAERTKEIGIRMALGSSARAVIRLVTKRIVGMIAIGLSVGAVGSVWLSRLLASKLFGVTPLDPPSYAFAAVAMIVLGIVASASPAKAATRVNPVDALRHE